MVALDLNDLDDTQMAWLETDLTTVNRQREKTPWVMVMSHYPLAHSRVDAHLDHSLEHCESAHTRASAEGWLYLLAST